MSTKYNPYAIRRNVRHDTITPGNIAIAKTKSFTQDSNDDAYHPAINLKNGNCFCDCGDFTYRKARLSPNVAQPETMCKHLTRYAENLQRKGELHIEAAAPVAPAKPEPTAAQRKRALELINEL